MSLPSFRALATLMLLSALAACGRMIPPGSTGAPPAPRPQPATPRPTLAPPPILTPPAAEGATPTANAASAGLVKAPDIEAVLPRGSHRSALALRAFRVSCPSLLRRRDQSGLTQSLIFSTTMDTLATIAKKGQVITGFTGICLLGRGIGQTTQRA